ncbi:MAG TPA: 2-succinyl-5-enolpyruvyl-6-hydroxy-3-cyclohexene-1-carboxylic-acid synthase [Ktedonobacteraceae bacterium]|nr:2-succinyl-5-enolpyruvyl-6-hydroxy-3-cyclohexene-1-carboxylic-acid synthase [Ktedonobacteraceae bacterium]
MTTLPDPANATYVYVGAFVDELARADVRNVVICPGSRSTPLALTFAEHPEIRVWMHIDERSAAFFALGMAKRSEQPVALLCSSGTAAANFFPAIIEAKLTHVSLLILTADRPHELRDCGAPQAIDQNRLYGAYPKWFVDVLLPEATNAALRYIRTLAGRAAALARAVPAGPVHLNFPLREPLTPDPSAGQELPPPAQRDPIAWYGRPGNAPYIEVTESPLAAPPISAIRNIAAQLQAAPRGLIVVGPQHNPALADELTALARRLDYPILADALSQVRCGPRERNLVLSSYDAFLRDDAFISAEQPQIVLRFGAMPTAKPLLLYLQRYPTCPQIVIDGNAGWEEPTQLASTLIHADPVAFCQELLVMLDAGMGGASPRPYGYDSWLESWQEADRVTREALQAAIQDFAPFFEGRVFSELAELLPDEATLYAGNSMPVRDLDTFFWSSARRLRIMGNRGANGIDGVLSSALGASAAAPEQPTVLVVGDLSFLHDLNGLLAARLHRLNLTIILVNNDGGGIFSFLPQAAHPEHFEQLFGTPTGLDVRPAVEMYGGQFQRVESWEQFRGGVRGGIAGTGLHVIEVDTERASNVSMHRQLWQVVTRALREARQHEE